MTGRPPSGNHVQMDDPRAAEGVEHLQTAARELLKAARSFLDVVEDVVEDPERVGGAAAGLADLVTSALRRAPAPWESAVRDDDHDDLWGPDDATDEPSTSAASGPVDRPDRPPAPRRRAPASRVRRIAVD